MNENNEKIIEEITEENLETATETEAEEKLDEYVDNFPKEKTVKKHTQAAQLVEKARIIVKDAEDQNTACRLLLEGDLKEYEEAKVSLRDGGLDACSYLLQKMGYKNTLNENSEEQVVVFEPKEDLIPIALKDVSSGRFTGFMYSLIGGTLTATGLIYLATEKLGLTLDITKIPSRDEVTSILSWFSTAVGLESNMYIGAGIFALSTLAIMSIIYAIRVGIKGSNNLNFAVKQLVEAEVYTEHKGDCKNEMDKVDAHIKDTIVTLKTYEVLLNEQKGKLERILHIEGEKLKSTDYHDKSFAEIRETKELVRAIRDFTSTQMSEEGKLSEKSVQALKRAKTQMDKMLERLY